MIESATNKLLHAPTTRLKAGASADDGADLVRSVVHLFDLPEAPAEHAERPAASAAATGPAAAPAPAQAASSGGASPDDDERLH